MKALSLIQPWAELILRGKKTIETRVWNTKLRGPFLIHASGNIDLEGCKEQGIDPALLPRGAIIGKAELVDVIKYKDDEDFLKDSGKHLVTKQTLERTGWKSRKKYGFVLKNVQRTEPRKCKGSLGFWDT